MSSSVLAPVTERVWALDSTHSTLGFSVVYMGVAPFEASFTDVTASLDEHGLRGTARADSIDVGDENLAGHLASPEFFDAANHPELSFVGAPPELDGEAVTVEGTLTIKGNAVPVTLRGTATGPVADPWGNLKLALALAGAVNRHDFGLDWNAPRPDGGTILGDDVTLSATLVFVAPATDEK
ncbi:MAG: YceI family protein [Gaiellales bacterium]